MIRFIINHKTMKRIILTLLSLSVLTSFGQQVNPQGANIESRFPVPPAFQRIPVVKGSFAAFLRNFPLKPNDTSVYLFDGRKKTNAQHVAVLNIDRGTKDLQQCADAVIRLRSEYLFSIGNYAGISFANFSEEAMRYDLYRQGYRMTNKGYKKIGKADSSKDGFRKYLDMVFSYANTYTFEKELKSIQHSTDLTIGDVFIVSNPKSYGHAMLIMDVAENPKTKEKVFLLAQSYMPAQDIHLVRNPIGGGAWYYSSDLGNTLYTPEWTFPLSALHRF